MVISLERLRVSWPPDGCRTWPSGSGFVPPISATCLEAHHPFTIISMDRYDNKGVFTRYRGTRAIVLFGNRLWWYGTSVTSSIEAFGM